MNHALLVLYLIVAIQATSKHLRDSSCSSPSFSVIQIVRDDSSTNNVQETALISQSPVGETATIDNPPVTQGEAREGRATTETTGGNDDSSGSSMLASALLIFAGIVSAFAIGAVVGFLRKKVSPEKTETDDDYLDCVSTTSYTSEDRPTPHVTWKMSYVSEDQPRVEIISPDEQPPSLTPLEELIAKKRAKAEERRNSQRLSKA